MSSESYASVGHVVQIIGPVVDIQFDADKLPPIYNAIHITSDGYNIPQPLDVIAEVQRHLGEGRVRTVARSEEHTSELQSPCNLVCRLLLEKKNKKNAALDAHDHDAIR